MAFETHAAAIASLLEFSPEMRVRHRIIKFWSEPKQRFLYCRVLAGKYRQ